MAPTPVFPRTPNHPKALTQRPLLIDAHNLVQPSTVVTPLIYGGFIEHLGRCIYGGIVDDPKAPSPEDILVPQQGGRLAWRNDVIKVLKDDLEVPLMRWPGGESSLDLDIQSR